MSSALLIVDPQYDFIQGSLPVPGAASAMDNLARYVGESGYALYIATLDQHPSSHCSFSKNGGSWPVHCLSNDPGGEIWPPLAGALARKDSRYFPKGTLPGKEEYSVWQSDISAPRLQKLLSERQIERIDICGIAGDICVLNTLKDGIQIYGAAMFRVLPGFSPSLDGGAALANFCREAGICAR